MQMGTSISHIYCEAKNVTNSLTNYALSLAFIIIFPLFSIWLLLFVI